MLGFFATLSPSPWTRIGKKPFFKPFFFAFLDILDKSAPSHFPKTMLRACITPNHYASSNVFLSSLTLYEYKCN